MISGCGFTIQKSRKLFREIVQHPLNAKILVLENKELYGNYCVGHMDYSGGTQPGGGGGWMGSKCHVTN